MMRILIVDDDPSLLRGLARLLSWKRDDLHITPAADGQEAIELLEVQEFDVVLTDLHMPHVDGFDLVAWVVSNKPHVVIFAMTAFSDEHVKERLQESAGVRCFTKPLNAKQLLECLDAAYSERMVGHIRNISLTTLLQLMEMEQKSCVLTVESGSRGGRLFMDSGRLVHAQTGSLVGDEAAIQIAGWLHASVSISTGTTTSEATVSSPLRFIMMEACRVMDEEAKAAQKVSGGKPETAQTSEIDDAFSDMFSEQANEAATFSEEGASAAPLSEAASVPHPPQAPRLPEGTDALAVVECATGRVCHHIGSSIVLAAAAELASELLRKKKDALRSLGLLDSLEEIVITSQSYATVIRPLASDESSFALLLFDPSRSTIGMERLVLDNLLASSSPWFCRGSMDQV